MRSGLSMGKSRILIVEDNQDHRELLIDALSNRYIVDAVESGQLCLDIIEKEKYDLIILDYYLKEKYSGLDLLKKINQEYADLPVIMVTAYGDEDVAVNALKLGAKDYIRKTLNNSYIEKIQDNINSIIKQNFVKKSKQIKQILLDIIIENEKKLALIWKKQVKSTCKKMNLDLLQNIKNENLEYIFISFIADIQNEKISETVKLLKKILYQLERSGQHIHIVEILNISFRIAVHKLMISLNNYTIEEKELITTFINTLIDEIDIELCKEYDKIINESKEQIHSAQWLNTKLLLMRTIQHEIRQPLTYIYNTIELLIDEEETEHKKQILTSILSQTKKIDKMLMHLEKNQDIPLKKYSDQLPMVDMSDLGEEFEAG